MLCVREHLLQMNINIYIDVWTMLTPFRYHLYTIMYSIHSNRIECSKNAKKKDDWTNTYRSYSMQSVICRCRDLLVFFLPAPHFYVSYKTINKQNEKLHHYFTRESVFCIQVTILIIRLFLIHPLFSFFYFLQPKIRQTDCSKLLYDDILFNQAEFCVCGFFSMSDFCWPILVKPKILYWIHFRPLNDRFQWNLVEILNVLFE